MPFVLKPPAYLAAVTFKCQHFQNSEPRSQTITNLFFGCYTVFILWNLRPSTIRCIFIPSLLMVLVFFRSDRNSLSQLQERNVLCKDQIGNTGLNMLFYVKLLSVHLNCVFLAKTVTLSSNTCTVNTCFSSNCIYSSS